MQLDPNRLLSIEHIRSRAKAIAMLDAIISPEWDYRYYSFNKNWGEGEEMASMRNGSGDEWFILFGDFGAAIKGLDHESEIAKGRLLAEEVQRQVPRTFSSFLTEPAFSMNHVSFCYWRSPEDAAWHKVLHANIDLLECADGSSEFLELLVQDASSYHEYACAYCEVSIPIEAVEKIYSLAPLTPKLVESINAEVSMAMAVEFALEIGYPVENVNA